MDKPAINFIFVRNIVNKAYFKESVFKKQIFSLLDTVIYISHN